ncbi:MAG TPA: DUF6463 family protein [Thermomicrobiales bacterium]|nr:DUF6463 family protein [Thermomicrobiales bacterium]
MHAFARVKNYVGEAIVAVGVLHTLSAVVDCREQWRAMREDGWWGSVEVAGAGQEGEALWFAVAGLSYLFTGLLVRSHLRATGTLPLSFAAGMTVVALGLSIALPASGAWMALACGVWSVLVAAAGPRAAVEMPTGVSRPRYGPEDLVV